MPRIRTMLVVEAVRFRAERAGAFVTLAARGDPDAGDLAIKVVLGDGRARLVRPEPDAAGFTDDGPARWRWPVHEACPSLPEPEIDAALARARARDPDLWILEIEDRAGRSFVDEPG